MTSTRTHRPGAVLTVRPGRPGDIRAVAGTIAATISNLPICAWLVPDPGQRPSVLRPLVALHVEHAIGYGHVDVLDRNGGRSGVGVAVWVPASAPPIPRHDARLAAICGPSTPRVRALRTAIEDRRSGLPGCTRLLYLAVQRGWRGQGFGTHMVAHRHARLDRSATPAMVVAPTTTGRDLFTALGYTAHPVPLGVPGHAGHLFVMGRAPAPPDRPGRA